MKNNEIIPQVTPQEPTYETQPPVAEQQVPEKIASNNLSNATDAQSFNSSTPQQIVQQNVNAPIAPSPNGLGGFFAKAQTFGIGPIITIAAVAAVLVGGVILSVASTTPKSVFKKAINSVYKEANVVLDDYETYLEKYDLTENAFLVNADFKFDTNMNDSEYSELKNMSLGFNTGVDYKHELLSIGANIKGPKESIEFNSQFKEKELYLTSSLFKEIVKIDSTTLSELGINIDFEEIKEEIKKSQKEYDTDPETYEYLVKTIKKALINSIDSEYMEKEKDEIDVLDKELKVTKYSYKFDEDAIQDLLKELAENLLEEEDFAKTFADAFGVEKKEVKELLKTIKKSAKDIKFDEEYAINIYTRGLFNSYAGIGVELEGKEYISLYTDGKNIEFTYDDHDDSDYGTKIVITMEKDGKGYKVEAKENKEKFLDIKIKEMTDEVIDAEITIYENKEKLGKFDVYLKIKESKKKFIGEYKLKATLENKEYIGFSGTYTIEIKDSIEKMNTKNSISFDELDFEKIEENIDKIAEKDEILGTLIDDTMSTIEEEVLDLNSNGMAQINSSQVDKVLSQKRATILYVGAYSYGAYSSPEAYNMLENLTTLQDELDFYSYYLNEYVVNSEFKDKIKDVQHICPSITSSEPTNQPSPDTSDNNESTIDTPADNDSLTEPQTDNNTNTEIPTQSQAICNEFPAIYLIQDGKIQKAFRQNVSYDDLKAALAEIGIK